MATAGSMTRAQQATSVLWAAFLVAGVLEMVVFALVDPATLRWFGGDALDLPPRAVYTLAFFVFWAAVAVGAALSLLLCGGLSAGRDGDAAPEPQAR